MIKRKCECCEKKEPAGSEKQCSVCERQGRVSRQSLDLLLPWSVYVCVLVLSWCMCAREREGDKRDCEIEVEEEELHVAAPT
jgi:hypothetical protein